MKLETHKRTEINTHAHTRTVVLLWCCRWLPGCCIWCCRWLPGCCGWLSGCCVWLLGAHLSLLPSGNDSQGISTNRPGPRSTASHLIARETVGQLWKCSIRGRPAPAGSSVTVNFLSCGANQKTRWLGSLS